MANKLVRIVVVGDEGVGKSALVSAAVHNIFAESPPPTLPPTRLPSETVESYMSPAPPTLLVDTCSRSEEKQAWELNVLEANVIVLAFAANDLESLRRVAMHWIPELERVGVHTPIILTACKSDLANVREEQISSVSLHQLLSKPVNLCHASLGTSTFSACFAVDSSHSHRVQAH